MSISVIRIGWTDYATDSEVASQLLRFVAEGRISSCTKQVIDGETLVVVGKPIDLNVENLEIVTSEAAKIAELKKQLKELEAKVNG